MQFTNIHTKYHRHALRAFYFLFFIVLIFILLTSQYNITVKTYDNIIDYEWKDAVSTIVIILSFKYKTRITVAMSIFLNPNCRVTNRHLTIKQ